MNTVKVQDDDAKTAYHEDDKIIMQHQFVIANTVAVDQLTFKRAALKDPHEQAIFDSLVS